MSEPFLIRDVYSSDVVKSIANNIKEEYKTFDKKGFLQSILPELDQQTYSERKESITNALISYLPDSYEDAVKLLLEITPPPYEDEEISGTLERFYISTFTSYISRQGLDVL